MRKRTNAKRFSRTRQTHDPSTTLPSSLQDQLSLPNGTSPTTKPTSRKEKRKLQRQEKKRAGEQATLEWRARRKQKPVDVNETGKNDVAAQQKSAESSSNKGNELKSAKAKKVKKRKRTSNEGESAITVSKTGDVEEQKSQPQNEDPDLLETKRLEKLLGIDRRKKRKKARGGTFSYADIFEEEEDMVDLLNFCDKSTRELVMKKDLSNSTEDEEKNSNVMSEEENPDDYRFENSNSSPSEEESEPESEIESLQEASQDENISKQKYVEERSGSEVPIENSDIESSQRSEELPPPRQKSGKYIPPGARGEGSAKLRINRRIRGLLNRVADANASGISGSIIQLFEARDTGLEFHAMTSIYSTCALDSVREGSGVGYINPYVHSHAAIASHVAFRVDESVLAKLVVQLVRRIQNELQSFQEQEADITTDQRNDAFGYVAMLCSLYERRAVACSMIYDLVRLVATSMTNSKLELLLAILRQVGPQLRLDDPVSLKDIIEFIHEQADVLSKQFKETGQEETSGVKLQVMLDLVNDIKNNKVKRALVQEASSRFDWAGAPPRPLELPLMKALDDSFTSGRWWDKTDDPKLVQTQKSSTQAHNNKNVSQGTSKKQEGEPDLALLASSLRLNSEYRKALFKAVMSSLNVSDAFERLERMAAFDTNKSHSRDMALVILHCCGAEKSFNPFYAYLAERMCKRSRKLRFTFEFALWDIFKTISGTSKTGSMSERKASNFGQLLAHLWSSGALSLSVLRCVGDFEEGSEQEKSFYTNAMRLFFSKHTAQKDEDGTAPFRKLLKESWTGIDSFRTSFALFLRRQVQPVLSKPQRLQLVKAIKLLEDNALA